MIREGDLVIREGDKLIREEHGILMLNMEY